jgi:hypothetical protein
MAVCCVLSLYICDLLFSWPAAGRWKATSVAVKVIEHRAGNSSKGVSAGREELLAATSHPNVVGTVCWVCLRCHCCQG